MGFEEYAIKMTGQVLGTIIEGLEPYSTLFNGMEAAGAFFTLATGIFFTATTIFSTLNQNNSKMKETGAEFVSEIEKGFLITPTNNKITTKEFLLGPELERTKPDGSPDDPSDPSNQSGPQEDKNDSVSEEESKTNKTPKVKVPINFKALLGLFNCLGFLGFFISSKAFTPYISCLLFILHKMSSYYSPLKNLVKTLFPVARTVTLFDSIRVIIFNGIIIVNMIFFNGEMISYWLIVEIIGYIFVIAKLSENSFFEKAKRCFSHYIYYIFIAMFYTFFSPEGLSTPIYKLITFFCFLFSLLQLHWATSTNEGSWLGKLLRFFSPNIPDDDDEIDIRDGNSSLVEAF